MLLGLSITTFVQSSLAETSGRPTGRQTDISLSLPLSLSFYFLPFFLPCYLIENRERSVFFLFFSRYKSSFQPVTRRYALTFHRISKLVPSRELTLEWRIINRFDIHKRFLRRHSRTTDDRSHFEDTTTWTKDDGVLLLLLLRDQLTSINGKRIARHFNHETNPMSVLRTKHRTLVNVSNEKATGESRKLSHRRSLIWFHWRADFFFFCVFCFQWAKRIQRLKQEKGLFIWPSNYPNGLLMKETKSSSTFCVKWECYQSQSLLQRSSEILRIVLKNSLRTFVAFCLSAERVWPLRVQHVWIVRRLLFGQIEEKLTKKSLSHTVLVFSMIDDIASFLGQKRTNEESADRTDDDAQNDQSEPESGDLWAWSQRHGFVTLMNNVQRFGTSAENDLFGIVSSAED